MNKPVLTASRLDAMFPDKREVVTRLPNRSSLATESLWGPKQIGAFMGLSPDTIRRMVKNDPTFPARLRFGRLYVTRTEIVIWLQPRHDDVRQPA